MTNPETDPILTREEQSLLTHAFAAWIKTTRGDKLKIGRSTEGAIINRVVHREFWAPWDGDPVQELVDKKLLTWGHNEVNVGITVLGLQTLRRLDGFTRIQQEYRRSDIAHAASILLEH